MLKIIILLLLFNTAYSQVTRNFNKSKKPLYELGAGVITLNVPDYPGADNSNFRGFPFPFFIYRGDLLRADEDGSRVRFIDSELVELGMSGGFNFPIDSNSNRARRGMPNTDTLFGIGPNILMQFFKDDPLQKLTLGMGIRTNIGLGDFNSLEEGWFLRDEGLIVEPTIRYWRKFSEDGIVTLFTGLSFSYADQKYNRFFYQVDSEFETSEREAYKAKAGLVDIAASLGISFDFKNKSTIFAGAFGNNLSASANKKSPLVENEHNSGFVLGYAWLFFESEKLVD